MSDYTDEPEYIRIRLYGRTDGMQAIGLAGPSELAERKWKLGDIICFSVVGIERTTWEGRRVL